jgi:hypothetical protein
MELPLLPTPLQNKHETKRSVGLQIDSEKFVAAPRVQLNTVLARI